MQDMDKYLTPTMSPRQEVHEMVKSIVRVNFSHIVSSDTTQNKWAEVIEKVAKQVTDDLCDKLGWAPWAKKPVIRAMGAEAHDRWKADILQDQKIGKKSGSTVSFIWQMPITLE